MSFTNLMSTLWSCFAIICSNPVYSDDMILLSVISIAQNLCPSYSPSCRREETQPITPCCGKCDCEANCRKYGSCCLSEYTSFSQAQESVENSRYGCVKPQFLRSKSKTDFVDAMESEAVWMITKCHSRTTMKNRNRCEHPDSSPSIEALLPVFYEGRHYRNKFCAYCNGLSEDDTILTWRLEILCNEPILNQLVNENLLSAVEKYRCNIFYRPPFIRSTGVTPTETCKEQVYRISTCNETGLWPKFNPIYDMGCKSFVDAFNMTYKNYFCYLCNTDRPSWAGNWTCPNLDVGQGGSLQPPFVTILDLSAVQNSNTQELECNSQRQFEDKKKMKCRAINCASDTYLRHKECHSVNSSSSDGRCYVMFIKLTPASEEVFLYQVLTSKLYQNNLQMTLRELLGDTSDYIEEFYLFGKRIVLGDNIHTADYVVIKMIVYIPLTEKTNILSHFVDVFHRNRLTVEVNGIRMYFEAGYISYNLLLFSTSTESVILVPGENGTSLDAIEEVPVQQHKLINFSLLRCNGYKPFSKLDICPFVEISRTDLNYDIKDGYLIINETFLFKVINSWEFQSTQSSIYLCVDDYKTVYNAMPQVASYGSPIVTDPKEILSLICVSMSIVCLLITISIYLTLTELHSQPGINTIILCVTLLLAQITFQFGSGQTDRPKWECAIIGALCHFLWLSVMFAMNICSVDMFRIFRKLQILSPFFSWKGTAIRLLYIVLASLFFVLLNSIISLSISNGDDFGYGGKICYLSSTDTHLVTFIIPSMLTILINFSLFFYVVMKIGQTQLSSAHLGQERNYFGVYVRLSTLTGITWLLGYLQILIKNEVLEYQFILLNAGQGVFIMLAFVCNKRIYKLFRRKTFVSLLRHSKTDKTVSGN